MSLVECVPNVSEGRNGERIKLMADSISNISDVTLLHTDSNPDANRTVFTFAGKLQAVCNAAYQLTQTTRALIDMRSQKGEHVRNGAVDVCPLIPVQKITVPQCVDAAKKLGARIGASGIPVYLYGLAATHPDRETLSVLRKGQYEALKEKMKITKWTPDFGPSAWNEQVARSGSVQVGVRPFLIALNVNLKTKNVGIAKKIARVIRTSGFKGQPGEFKALKADGWWMETYNCAQVTMNFTDYRITPPHMVLHRIAELAKNFGTTTNGSELIGLIPKAALAIAGECHSFSAASDSTTDSVIRKGIEKLGLGNLHDFVPSERIFEFRLEQMGINNATEL